MASWQYRTDATVFRVVMFRADALFWTGVYHPDRLVALVVVFTFFAH